MSIYVCFKNYIIGLYNADKALSKLCPTLQTACDLVENWQTYSLIFVEATFVTLVVTE